MVKSSRWDLPPRHCLLCPFPNSLFRRVSFLIYRTISFISHPRGRENIHLATFWVCQKARAFGAVNNATFPCQCLLGGSIFKRTTLQPSKTLQNKLRAHPRHRQSSLPHQTSQWGPTRDVRTTCTWRMGWRPTKTTLHHTHGMILVHLRVLTLRPALSGQTMSTMDPLLPQHSPLAHSPVLPLRPTINLGPISQQTLRHLQIMVFLPATFRRILFTHNQLQPSLTSLSPTTPIIKPSTSRRAHSSTNQHRPAPLPLLFAPEFTTLLEWVSLRPSL